MHVYNALGISNLPKKGNDTEMKKLFALLLAAMLLLSCSAMAASYTAGDYTVTVDGHNGTVTLTVTTSDTAITAIKVVEHAETANLGDTAMDKVIADIIAANSADVQAVSGATISSEAVKKAVAEALVRAEKGEVDAAAEEAEAVRTFQTFAEQCYFAGIDYVWEDPNAEIFAFESTNPELDVVTHASGPAKYVDETEGPCIKTPLDLAARSAVKVKVYYWTADENGVSTLEEAAKLEDAKYISEPFPNDGGKYVISNRSNGYGTKTVITINEDGTPCAAVYGLSFKVNGDEVTTSCAIMSETATYRNLLAGSPVQIVYYEYNPYSAAKIGIGTRNAGARVYCELDEERSTITLEKDAEGNAVKMTVKEFKAMSEEERAKLDVNYITMVCTIVEFNSIG